MTEAALAAELRFLASDELRGRKAGTPWNDVAARYIAEQFRAAGLEPAPGTDDFYQSVPLPRPLGTSENVAGVLQGSDPDLRDEYIVLMAHFDHVGTGMEAGPGASTADSIFNGARDNGMGVVAVMAAAKALAERPPARSVLFLAVTAEEEGMVGSLYFAEHPLIPLSKVVYALNIDGAGFSDTTVVTMIGLGRTSADSLIRKAAARYRLEVIPDPAPEEHLFDRSDNVSLARKGIPAPTLSPGFHDFSDAGVADYYHRPSDEAGDDFDYAYLLRFAQAYTHAARLIADSPTRPVWKAGDPYEPAARALYGGSR